jgi:hypothetical protein
VNYLGVEALLGNQPALLDKPAVAPKFIVSGKIIMEKIGATPENEWSTQWRICDLLPRSTPELRKE